MWFRRSKKQEKVRVLTYERALQALQRVVKGREDYVYPDSLKQQVPDRTVPVCMYFLDDQEPGCIIGAALADLGYTREDLSPYEGKSARQVLAGLGIDYDAKAARLFEVAQGEQDSGRAWGGALAFALGDVKESQRTGELA